MSKSHVIRLADLDLIPDLSGALFIPAFDTLVVADLHLEQGASLARRGIHVPPYDSKQSLGLLNAVLANIAPKRLILLGDSFHDRVASDLIDAADRATVTDITQRIETIWITGNHDPAAPQHLGGAGAEIVVMGPLTLRHEPKAILRDEWEIAGHLHPGATISHRGHQVRGKCFISDQNRLILPAFGSYTGAFSVSADAFNGLFDIAAAHVLLIGNQSMHRFPRKRVR